jgi:hypothetical protein
MRVTDLSKLFRRLLAASRTRSTQAGEEAVRLPDAKRMMRAAQERKKAPPGAGRLALLLQRIAADSAVLASAQIDELATALKVFDGPIADPIALARRSSDALVNALVVARAALLLHFPARVFLSAAQGEYLPRRIWLRVGPHPTRIRLPLEADDLAAGIQAREYSRADVRALAYVLGVGSPRVLVEFDAMRAGQRAVHGGALHALGARARLIHELFAQYRLGDSVYAALDVRPHRALQQDADADADVTADHEEALADAAAAPPVRAQLLPLRRGIVA